MLNSLERFDETKSLLRKTMPVARRSFEESSEMMLRMRWIYAGALYKDDAATLDDLLEAAATLAKTERTARRVFGSAHPLAKAIGNYLRDARAALQAAILEQEK